MDTNILIGIFLILLALTGLVSLVWWSRNRINRINDMGPTSARAILHGLPGEEDDDE